MDELVPLTFKEGARVKVSPDHRVFPNHHGKYLGDHNGRCCVRLDAVPGRAWFNPKDLSTLEKVNV